MQETSIVVGIGIGFNMVSGEAAPPPSDPETWAGYATGGTIPKTWTQMETGGSYERTWTDLET